MTYKTPAHSSVITFLSYRNAPAAIEWLCRVFGFEKHAVYEGPNNTIAHSELTLGNGMIMVGSWTEDNPLSTFMKQPDQLGGVETRGDNLVVGDADAVYARVKAAAAEILFDIEDKPYGGRGFTCRDLEGRIWTIGTYDPWQPK